MRVDIYWEVKGLLVNPENQSVINAFLLDMKNKGKSRSTVSEYRKFLHFFFKERKETFSSISQADIIKWLADRQTKKSKITMIRNIRVLCSFYEFCEEKGYVEKATIQYKESYRARKKPYWELRRNFRNPDTYHAVQAYLLSEKEANTSKDYVARLRSILQYFFEDLEAPLRSITQEHIQRWLEIQEKEHEKYALASCVSALRSFFSFCQVKGYIDDTPVDKKRWVQSAEKYWEVQQPLPNKDNVKVINDFLLYLKNKNKSEKTIEEYRILLQMFFRGRKEHFTSITDRDIQEWREKFKINRSKKRVITSISFLRMFYHYCFKQGYIETSPVKYSWENKTSNTKYWELKKPVTNQRNQLVINEYLGSMKIMNLSEGTIALYRFILQKFFEDKEEPFYQLSSNRIREWIMGYSKVLAENTISNYLSALSSFYNFCVDEEYLDKSPIKTRWYPRLSKPVPKYLEKEEIVTVRSECEKELFRNRVIVEFLLATGCRIGEVHKLNIKEVDLENRSARVVGKGKKIRTVHFTEKCALLLERYLESREDDHPALFVNKYETRFSMSGMRRRIQQIGKQVGIPLHPHRFRHTFATELMAKGADISFVSNVLGHSDLEPTKVYAQLPERELISMYRKFMG